MWNSYVLPTIFFNHASLPRGISRALSAEDDAGVLVNQTRQQYGAANRTMRGMRAYECKCV